MQIAIIGLPWTGRRRSSHARGLRRRQRAARRVGAVAHAVVRVPDGGSTTAHTPSGAKRTPATIEYLDVPGLDLRRERGHGVPGSILAQIKNARALLE